MNADSQNSFGSSGHSGGEILDRAGTIQVTGLFQYTNIIYRTNSDYWMRKGSSDADRDIDILRKSSPEELEIFLAARQLSVGRLGRLVLQCS